MGKYENKFSWVNTHKEIVEYLKDKQDKQKELIKLLKSVGIKHFSDEFTKGKKVDLQEIDPFTFFCYIYKHRDVRRLEFLKKIAEKLNLTVPEDTYGVPSVNPQMVWMFPYKYDRKNDDIQKLWNIFHSALKSKITDDQFQSVLNIQNVGKTKITEALYIVNPERYFPIDIPTKSYLSEYLNMSPEFNTFSEYMDILKQIRDKDQRPFYELSYEAWLRNNQNNNNYWVFQGNPKYYDFEKAFREIEIDDWTVSNYKNDIKIGDKIIIWLTGKNNGVYALAEVTSEPKVKKGSDDDERYWKTSDRTDVKAGIKITHNLIDNPILKSVIDNVPELSNLQVGKQGTNFKATKEEYNSLLRLTKRSGNNYWVIGAGEGGKNWDEFYKDNVIKIGFKPTPDLNNFNSKDELRVFIEEKKIASGVQINFKTEEIWNFRNAKVGDLVLARGGISKLFGIAEITGDYFYNNDKEDFTHCRPVKWIESKYVKAELPEVWKFETFVPLSYSEFIKYKKIIEEGNKTDKDFESSLNLIFYGPPGTGKTYYSILRAAEIIEGRKIEDYEEAKQIFNDNLSDRIEFITFHQNYSYEDFIQGLRPDTENNNQLIFDRKDGIFKKIADRAMENLKLSEKEPEQVSDELRFDEALDKLKEEIQESNDKYKINNVAYIFDVDDEAFRYTGENWSYSNGLRMKFSDLKEFYRNDIKSRKNINDLKSISGLAKQHATYFYLVYEIIIKKLPKEKIIANIDKKNYVIVIDEINRANISRVFGELITLIEPDKRSGGSIPLKATLPSGDKFEVPSNLFIIGTMNTADKSIALLDIALRRRFEFEAMYPVYDIDGHSVYDKEVLKKINDKIIQLKGHDFQIGHSFFMDEHTKLKDRMNKKVIPLLLEYFMNDVNEVIEILKSAGLEVDKETYPLKIK